MTLRRIFRLGCALGFLAAVPVVWAGCSDAFAQPATSLDGGPNVAAGDGASDAPSDTRSVQSADAADAADAAHDAATDAPPDVKATTITEDLLEGRCRTAICLGNEEHKNFFGIEPLLELPIGKSFSFNSGGLADYVNNTELKVDFAAGLRVWVAYDWVSFALYFSQPITPRDSHVRIPGTVFDYPASYVRRPYPGFALGLLQDVLWIGLDRDELRNGSSDSSSTRDPIFPRNSLVSGVWTWTLAIQPFTTFRTGIGTILSKKENEARSKAAGSQ